ncbi:hypothetical protein D3C76_1303540 [compost metagenome]
MLLADPGPRISDGFGAGHLVATGLRAEAPEVEQRLHRHVEGAVAALRQLAGEGHQLQHGRRQCHAATGRQGVEALHLGVRTVGGHLPVDLREDSFDFAARLLHRGAGSAAHVLHRVAAAHGRAAELFQMIAAAGQQQAGRKQQDGRSSHRSRPAGCSPARHRDPAAS